MNNRIPLYLLESFIKAAEEASFQIASEKLEITQSTLSKQMIMLEEMLPHKVFTFDGRKKVLTPYGSYLLKALRPKFSQTQELIEQSALQFSQPEQINIRIAGRGELLDMLAIKLKFRGRISFLPMNNEDALHSVLERKSDMAIIHTGIESHEIIMKPYMDNSFKLVISKKLIKIKPKSMTALISKIRSLPCLLYKDKDHIFENVIQAWQLVPDQIKIHRSYPNYATLARMIDKGQGWGIIPTHIEINENTNYVFNIPVNPSIQRKFYLCYRRDISSAEWLKELLLDIRK